jgi:hypothetical protein
MDEAIGENAFEELHGPHVIPKTYKNPFSGSMSLKPANEADMDHIYNMDIEANLRMPSERNVPETVKPKPRTNDEMASAVEDLATNFGGRGGNLQDMKYIRLKIKTLRVDDSDILRQLI